MKYAIYDKAANGYLTKLEFENDVPVQTLGLICGYNEYITEAKLLDTKEEAVAVVTRIESNKFMEKGRYVMHSFDDTLKKDQYIISEAGNPTKVVDNITVDLDGNINVKYGTMVSHWSTAFLEYAINRMNALQKAKSPKYAAWCNTFDIYKVITVMDEKSCTHYQFIKVTEKGLTEYAKEEVDPLNKRIEELEKANVMLDDNVKYHNECRVALAEIIRAIKYAICSKDSNKCANYISYMTDRIKDDEIFNRPELKTTKNDIPRICKHLTTLSKDPLNKRIEELEKANYELGEQVAERGATANRLHEENDDLKTKVESIKKEARDWKKLYENVYKDREVLKNVIDNIYDDLGSTDIRKGLKETYNYVESISELNYIKIHNDDTSDGTPIYITAMSEFKYIIHQMIVIMESLELNQNVAFSSAEEVDRAKKLANAIIDISEATTDPFELTLEKFSQLYEAVNDPKDDDNTITHALKSVLAIFSALENKVRNIIDEMVTWKRKAMKAEKALDDQKKLNDANKATIAQMAIAKRAMNKELSDAADALKEVNDKNDALADMLREITNYVADIMLATRTVDRDTMISELVGISNKIGFKTSDDGPMFGVLVILNTIINIAKEGTDWKRRAEEVLEERDKAMDYCINDVNLTIEIDKLTSIRNSLAEVIYAIRNAIYNNNSDAFRCINNRMIHDADFNSSSFMAGVRENILDICNACEKNIANNDLKNSEIARLTDERDKALERAEFYKRQANSLYGMIIPCRCNGKQGLRDMLYEVKTGMKVLVDKEKYDSLVECVNNINVTYEILKCTDLTMDKPLWFDGVITRIKTLTK